MMMAMHERVTLLVLLGAALALAAVGPAKAQFYDLDGVYHCVTAPNAACNNAEHPLPPPQPPPPATPTIDELIARIRAQKVTANDIAVLDQLVAAKQPRAVEALAWCKLNGIGMPADPVAAYVLYGEAAQLGIPTARSNQIAIFETRLTQQQRQLVLMREQTK